MTTSPSSAEAQGPLRARAERLLELTRTHPLPERSQEEIARLVHELGVHEVELEMQNQELRRTQQALETSRARYLELYDGAPVGYLALSEDGAIVEANLTAARLLGEPRLTLVGRPVTGVLAPRSQDEWYRFSRRLHDADAPQEADFEFQRQGAASFWARVEAARAPSGQYRLAISDVTRRRAAELALLESNTVNETLLRTIPLPMEIVDAQGTILFASAHLESVHGRRLAGEHCWPLLRDDGQRCPRCPLNQALEIGKTSSVECTGGRGGKTWEIFHTALEYQGRPAMMEVFFDVTERRRAEAEHRKLQADFYESQKLEAIGTLAGGVAHDFNNILGAIRGAVTLVQHQVAGDAQARADLADVQGLVTRGADLARQLLGFARRGQYDVRPLSLPEVLRKTTSLFGRTRPDLTLQLDVAPALHAVLMDYTQLEQVLLNILVNAGQAMPGEGRLTVTAGPTTFSEEEGSRHGVIAGEYVRVVVTDTGVGMSPETRARAFEPFFTTKPVGQGTGLGLSSAYGILRSHGGGIAIESVRGQGTSVTLLLPTTHEVPAVPVTPVPAARGEGTVLVVDDEPMLVKTLARLLRSLGYQVLTAGSGAQALEVVKAHSAELSLVILDMTMPVMSGAQTFDRLRELAPDLRVLLSSGFSVEGQAQDLLSRGCAGFLQKPFSLEDLSLKVGALMKPGKKQAAPAA